MGTFIAGYTGLYQSGELARRVGILTNRLASCDICPRKCSVNRCDGIAGFCHSAFLPVVAAYCAHYGEEPPLSGTRGSGTIFFGNCTMRCVYCQNYQISQAGKIQKDKEISISGLAEGMLSLQYQGCHNINLVTPTHFLPQILMAVLEAVPKGLRLPLVYNTSGYESVEIIRMLDGIVDIYLPDLRYAPGPEAGLFSAAHDYAIRARESIKEMYRQVGELISDDSGVAQRGLIVRHLILPEGLTRSKESLTWLANNVSPAVSVSVMSQYYPAYRASRFPALAKKITLPEYREVASIIEQLGFENGWMQDMEAAENYLPDFVREGNPFSNLMKPYVGKGGDGKG